MAGGVVSRTAGAAGAGATAPPDLAESDVEYFVNADIEPDADCDRYGDETQDACPADPQAHRPRARSTSR